MSLLLSPAGSPEALKAAIAAGADEVYLGGEAFNARVGAKNFTRQQLTDAGRLCRDTNTKLLITLNTLVADQEFSQVDDYVDFLQSEVHPAAYIVQDLGLAIHLKKRYPDLVLHASTQLRQHSSYGTDFLKSIGFTRVVLARETSKENIRSFLQNSGLECEIFVHGALCVCESGGCLMSSMIGKRSGNRGECAQPCRLPYQGKNRFPLSLKDNCLASYLSELSEMGVTALKIEGRMKSPDYVYTVTSVYRKILDEHRLPSEEELHLLEQSFSRNGFTDGYYTGKIGPQMFGVRTEESKHQTKSLILPEHGFYRKSHPPVQEHPGAVCLPEKVEERVYSPKAQLGYVARFEGTVPKSLQPFADAARIDIPVWKLSPTNIRGLESKISIVLPRVVFDSESEELQKQIRTAKELGICHATIPNISELPFVRDFYLHGDYPLNVYNKETIRIFEQYSFSSLLISPEIDPKKFGFTKISLECIGYGRVPLMHTETCILRNIYGHCLKQGEAFRNCAASCSGSLVDRTGASFPIIQSTGHRNLIYNSVPSYRLDQRKELKKSGVGLLTLLFTDETPEEMIRIVDSYRNALPPSVPHYTRR